jgi:hypothetical protein
MRLAATVFAKTLEIKSSSMPTTKIALVWGINLPLSRP